MPRTRETEIVLTARQFERIRADERFIRILALSRLVNAISIARGPLLAPLRWNTPRARRERFSALLYAGALLHEAFVLSQSLGAYFRHLPQYQRGFAKLAKSANYKKLRPWLKTIRNQAAFHFDDDLVRQSLRDAEPSEFRVMLMNSKRVIDIYHAMADDVVFWYLFGAKLTQAEAEERFAELAGGIADLFQAFMFASGILIPVALAELGCARRRTSLHA